MLPNLHLNTASPGVKISSGHTTTNGNGNGSDAVSGRGLAHRKWTLTERIAYAADVATGMKHLDLSQGQLCSMLADARTNLREIVDEVGLDAAMNLLSEMETQLQIQCGLYPMSK